MPEQVKVRRALVPLDPPHKFVAYNRDKSWMIEVPEAEVGHLFPDLAIDYVYAEMTENPDGSRTFKQIDHPGWW